jgi:GNAT superfamily N-acetyltransferase
MGKITAPEPITAAHILADFDCGTASLNDWLKRQALKNEISGASRTFVTCKDLQVVGFYALAVGSVNRKESPGKIKRKMPEPIPVMVLGRLAVDTHWQKSGIGRGLLKDAVIRTNPCTGCSCAVRRGQKILSPARFPGITITSLHTDVTVNR